MRFTELCLPGKMKKKCYENETINEDKKAKK